MSAKVGDLVVVRGLDCRVTAVLPAGTVEVESLTGGFAYRVSGLELPPARRYVVRRMVGGERGRAVVQVPLYYRGAGVWTPDRAEARRYPGAEASVVCENLNFRGVQATFALDTAEADFAREFNRRFTENTK